MISNITFPFHTKLPLKLLPNLNSEKLLQIIKKEDRISKSFKQTNGIYAKIVRRIITCFISSNLQSFISYAAIIRAFLVQKFSRGELSYKVKKAPTGNDMIPLK